jgi:hypothetical protein
MAQKLRPGEFVRFTGNSHYGKIGRVVDKPLFTTGYGLQVYVDLLEFYGTPKRRFWRIWAHPRNLERYRLDDELAYEFMLIDLGG